MDDVTTEQIEVQVVRFVACPDRNDTSPWSDFGSCLRVVILRCETPRTERVLWSAAQQKGGGGKKGRVSEPSSGQSESEGTPDSTHLNLERDRQESHKVESSDSHRGDGKPIQHGLELDR